MLSFAPDYDNLPLIAKVEVFEFALQNTEGNDLARVCYVEWYAACFAISFSLSLLLYFFSRLLFGYYRSFG